MRAAILRFAPWLILLLTAAVYLPAVLTNDFVSLDDTLLITRNTTAQGLSMAHIIAAFTTYDPELYIPLTLLTYQIEWSLFGPNPVAFHMTNLLLHLLSSYLVFRITRALARRVLPDEGSGLPERVALLCMTIFALHPLNTQAILWAAARKDVLSGFFALLSVGMYLRYRSSGSGMHRTAGIAAFGAGLLAKVSIAPLPLVLLGIDALERRKIDARTLREKLPEFVLAGIFVVIALFGKQTQLAALTMADQALLAIKATASILLRFVLPRDLSVFYPQTGPVSVAIPEFLTAALVVILLGAIALRSAVRSRLWAFGIGMFLLFLAPSWTTFWKNGFLYYSDDRYGDLALTGIAFAAAATLARAPRLLPAVTAALVLACVPLSVLQARTWRNSVTLYEQVLHAHPDSAHALANLGSALHEQDDLDAAEERYHQALAQNPGLPTVYVNLGKIAYDRGDRNAAEEWFRKGIDAIPAERPPLEDELSPYAFLGTLLEEQGRLDEALAAFATAADRGAAFPVLRLNQAIILHKYRRMPEARAALLQYLAERPSDLAALYRIAAIEGELGLIPEAIAHLEAVVDRDPDYEQAAEHLRNLRRMTR